MSQSAVILPGSPLTGAALASDLNASFASVISKFSGATAPTLGPGAASALVAGQEWLNTSVAGQYVWGIYDGAVFCPLATIDTTAHTATVPDGYRNIIGDNGSMEVWQRGSAATSSFAIPASTTAYTADRWYITTGANQASVVAAVTNITNGSQLAGKITRNSGQTGTGVYTFGFPLDTNEVVRLRGGYASINAVAKAGANWSPASGTLTLTFYVGTGAAAKRGAGFTSETNVVSGSVNLAVNAQGTITAMSAATVPTTATQGEIQFTWTPVGTAGGDDSITIDDVQLEAGLIANAYERRPFERMITGCKRHFWKTFNYGVLPAQNVGLLSGEIMGIAGKAGALVEIIGVRHPVSMRGIPVITTFNPGAANAQVRDETVPADCSSTANLQVTNETVFLSATGNASTAVGNILGVHLTADAGI